MVIVGVAQPPSQPLDWLGRTRLEGSTWYELEMAPEGYWQLWTDFLIHRIHGRVLNHIKNEVEANPDIEVFDGSHQN